MNTRVTAGAPTTSFVTRVARGARHSFGILTLGLVTLGAAGCEGLIGAEFDRNTGTCIDCDASDAATGSDASGHDEPNDAGTGPWRPDASARPCEGTHFLCTDFDTGPAEQGFTAANVSGAATLGLDKADFYSPRHSLRAALSGGGGQQEAGFAALIQTPPKRARLAFQLRMCPLTTGEVELVSLRQASGSGVSLVAGPNGARLVVTRMGQGTDPYPLATVLPVDAWVRVTIDVDFRGTASGSLFASLAGVVALHETNVVTAPEDAPVTVFGIGVRGATGCSVNFDDVVLDLEN